MHFPGQRVLVDTDKLKIMEGQVKVTSVTVLADHADIKAWLIDCDTKYADPVTTSSDGWGGLDLWAGERTLRSLDSEAPTSIRFPRPDSWLLYSDSGRYDFMVMMVDPVRGQRLGHDSWVRPIE